MSVRTVNFQAGEKLVQPILLSSITTSHNPRYSHRGLLDLFHEKGAAHHPVESRQEYIAHIEKEFPHIRLRAESLKDKGQIVPVTLRRFGHTNGERYGICQGECRILGWSLIEAETGIPQKCRAVIERLTVDEAFERGLAENIERHDMSPLDLAHSFHEMLTKRVNPATVSPTLEDGSENPLHDQRTPEGRPWTLREISEKYNVDYHFVRGRAALVYLSAADKLTVENNHKEGRRDITRFCKKATAIVVEMKAKAKESGQDVTVLLEQIAEQAVLPPAIQDENAPQESILTVPSQRRRVKKMKEVESLLDATPLENKERIMAFAEVMGLTYEVALAEREARKPKGDEQSQQQQTA